MFVDSEDVIVAKSKLLMIIPACAKALINDTKHERSRKRLLTFSVTTLRHYLPAIRETPVGYSSSKPSSMNGCPMGHNSSQQ